MSAPKVLIVDDSPHVRQLLQTILSRAGCTTVEAASGASAVMLASSHRPELIFLDVELPVMNGYKVCERIRASAPMSRPKIIMLTARTDDEDRELAMAAGADAFITKPFRPVALLATVTQLLGDASFQGMASAGIANAGIANASVPQTRPVAR